MFAFDKDMERLMLAKKKEVLAQLEEAKKRILEELYCVKRSVHTDFCEMLADYNRIDFALKKLVADLKQEVKDTVDLYKDILAEQILQFNTQIDTKINVFEQFVTESIATIESALAELETMQTTVTDAVDRLNELLESSVTREELEQAIANIDVTEELEQLATELRTEIANAGVQSDWNEGNADSKAYVKNRTHYGVISTITPVNNVNVADLEEVAFSPYCYAVVLPDLGVELNALSSLILTVDNVTRVLPFKLDNKMILKEWLEGTSQRVKYYFAKNIVTFGDNVGVETRFYEDKEGYLVYYNPEMQKYCITFGVFKKPEVFSLSVSYATEVHRIAPQFLGETNAPGSVLTFNGDVAKWEEPLLKKYTRYEPRTIVSGRTTMLPNSSSKSTLDTPGASLEVGREYYVTVNGSCYRRTCTTANKLTVAGNNIQVSIDSGVTTLYITGSYAPSDYTTNGAELTVETFDNVEYTEKVSADMLADTPGDNSFLRYVNGSLTWSPNIVLTSPNGTKYNVTVADDGTLSATPVTT